MLYQHGPRGGVHAAITAKPGIRPDTSTASADGPWALMRLLDKAMQYPAAHGDLLAVLHEIIAGIRRATAAGNT